MKAVIDGDPFVYACGFAEDSCASKDGREPDLSYALKIVRDRLYKSLDACADYFAGRCESELYLTGPGNFREKVATIKPYKGNRDVGHKPCYYREIKEYMIDRWHAIVVEGIEADDAIATRLWGDDEYDPQIVLITIDKDLDNVPGWHYNPNKEEFYFIDYQSALRKFYRQCLMGDPTDNIQGCVRVGKKKALQIIPEGDKMGELSMYRRVLEVYDENTEKYPEKHNGYTAEMALLENARLLWMQQHADQLWTPPDCPDDSVKEFMSR